MLDCLKLVLDNGWTVGTDEMIKFFDMLELSKKVSETEEFSAFIEFCSLLAMMLKVDKDAIEGYFTMQEINTNVADFMEITTDI